MKRRTYREEMQWYFDKENHTKLDKIEIFIFYTLPYHIKRLPRSVKYTSIRLFTSLLVKFASKPRYTACNYHGITRYDVLKGTDNIVLMPKNVFYPIRKTDKTLYSTIDEALTNLNVGSVVNHGSRS